MAAEHGSQSLLKCFQWYLQEIDELCEDWQPEPLFSHLTEAQKAYEPPVVSRCSPGVLSYASMSIVLRAILLSNLWQHRFTLCLSLKGESVCCL